ncbi:hypothetical protein F3Y22_tig00001238pilonHSYRG00002 [Hibiscus syriacus]|uniref:Uncharacterized protein n=1 Tax=Hibiscus syriacus TaxID=106335 RepID=A0A6A3CV54_HIBSY|nr:hypothetical protein F3Y22_tig00001238pilonHSYRG00002 [Hibiscus syriacus]
MGTATSCPLKHNLQWLIGKHQAPIPIINKDTQFSTYRSADIAHPGAENKLIIIFKSFDFKPVVQSFTPKVTLTPPVATENFCNDSSKVSVHRVVWTQVEEALNMTLRSVDTPYTGHPVSVSALSRVSPPPLPRITGKT